MLIYPRTQERDTAQTEGKANGNAGSKIDITPPQAKSRKNDLPTRQHARRHPTKNPRHGWHHDEGRKRANNEARAILTQKPQQRKKKNNGKQQKIF